MRVDGPVIRLPLWQRVGCCVAFGVVTPVTAVIGMVLAATADFPRAQMVAMCSWLGMLVLFGVTFAFRVWRMGAVIGGDRLVVRSVLWTRCIRREEVREIVPDPAKWSRRGALVASIVLTDGRRVPVFTTVVAPADRPRLHRHINVLEAWVRGDADVTAGAVAEEPDSRAVQRTLALFVLVWGLGSIAFGVLVADLKDMPLVGLGGGIPGTAGAVGGAIWLVLVRPRGGEAWFRRP